MTKNAFCKIISKSVILMIDFSTTQSVGATQQVYRKIFIQIYFILLVLHHWQYQRQNWLTSDYYHYYNDYYN